MSFGREPNGAPQITTDGIATLGHVLGSRIVAFRLAYRKIMERHLIAALSPTDYMVLSAIVSRTLGWRKLVEVIPISVFSQGMRDRYDSSEHLFDEEDICLFAGTNLDKLTIRRSLQRLVENKLIERYALPTPSRTVYAYSIVSQIALEAICYFIGIRWPDTISKLTQPRQCYTQIERLLISAMSPEEMPEQLREGEHYALTHGYYATNTE